MRKRYANVNRFAVLLCGILMLVIGLPAWIEWCNTGALSPTTVRCQCLWFLPLFVWLSMGLHWILLDDSHHRDRDREDATLSDAVGFWAADEEEEDDDE